MKEKKETKTPEQLYDLALDALETSSPEDALPYAHRLLLAVAPTFSPDTIVPNAVQNTTFLPALNLLGEINVELGDVEEARKHFLLAVRADPEGLVPDEQGGGAEKFFWLAQLSEEGGRDSVDYYEKGIMVLKREISKLEDAVAKPGDEQVEILLEEKREKIAGGLCAIVEIYMTDLSWEDDAEDRCEQLVTEACMLAPESPEPLQTLASVRLSQDKVEDARSALTGSLGLWKDLDPEDDRVPDFPTRISLARLLMEAEMEDDALEVLARLRLEDDQSVEACYLGGWCQYLQAEKRRKEQAAGGAVQGDSMTESGEDEETVSTLKSSRRWLLTTLRLYDIQDYEDDRLKAHTDELVGQLNQVLGPPPEDLDAEEEEEEEEWNGIEDGEDEDEDMAGT